MSLVGPRPAIPYEIDEYDLWHRRRVLEVKPGITGIWQVKGRSRTDFNNMVRMDIGYIQNWSPLLDLRLLLQTPLALVSTKGAY
jgi:lipopolysaccharide/colanic/teichoic acid biosynthesis glycosyltransferase